MDTSFIGMIIVVTSRERTMSSCIDLPVVMEKIRHILMYRILLLLITTQTSSSRRTYLIRLELVILVLCGGNKHVDVINPCLIAYRLT